MNEFQLPIILVFIFSCFISLLLNKVSLNFKNLIPKDTNDNEIRLSNLKIPTFGGIAMSIAFLVSIRLLGKADFDILPLTLGVQGLPGLKLYFNRFLSQKLRIPEKDIHAFAGSWIYLWQTFCFIATTALEIEEDLLCSLVGLEHAPLF